MALAGDLTQYVPHPKQARFHQSPARIRQFLGGNKGGKTVAGAAESLFCSFGWSPIRSGGANPRIPAPNHGWVVSSEFKVSLNIAEPIIRTLIPAGMIKTEDRQNRIIHLINGSSIGFKSFETGALSFASASKPWIWLDEEPPEDVWKECVARTIDVKGDIWLTMTALYGEDWSYEQIYRPWSEGDVLVSPDGVPELDVIEVDVNENPYIDPYEIARVSRRYSKHEIETRIKGHYASAQGRVFPEWSNSVHCIYDLSKLPDAGRINPGWTAIISMDHGSGNSHTAAYLMVLDDEGVIRVVREYYEEMGVPTSQHAACLKRLAQSAGIPMPIVYLDPAARQVAIDLQKYGVTTARANNDRVAGMQRLRERMACDHTGQPGIVLYPNVVRLPRDIPRYAWKPSSEGPDSGDRVKKTHDHSIDAWRYGVMALPDRPIKRIYEVGLTVEQRELDFMKKLIAAKANGKLREEYGYDGLG